MTRSMMTKPAHRLHKFSLPAPEARHVQLAGDFTQWLERAIDMQRGKDGIWHATVALEQGAHFYRFIVDGEWRDDPGCLVREPNPYGTQNAVRQVA